MTFSHIIDIFIGAGSYLFCYFLLPYIVLIVYQEKKITAFHSIIPIILISDGIFTITGSLIWEVFPQTKWAFLISSFSSVLCSAIFKKYSSPNTFFIRAKYTSNYENRFKLLVILVSIVSLFFIHDALIFLSQNWDDVTLKFYATSPLLLDPVRNTNLVAALLRNSNSIFTPEGVIAYQIFWHKGAALNSSVLPIFSKTAWYQVMGFTIATAIIYEIVIIWSVFLLSNTNSNKIFLAIAALFLARLDANLSYFFSFLEDKKYEYFSPTIMCLTAPQHTTSMLYFIAFITLTINDELNYLNLTRIFLGSGAVVFSPPLAAMGYPIYYFLVFIHSILFSRKINVFFILEAFFIIILASVIFTLTNDVSIYSHLFRDNLEKIAWFQYQIGVVPLYLLIVNSMGILSILTILALCFYLYCRFKGLFAKMNLRDSRIMMNCLLIILLSILIINFWNFIFTSVETRRHSSIFSVSMIIVALPIMISYFELKKINLFFSSFIIWLLFSHVNFVQSYLKKQSDIVTFINWEDYRCVGDLVKNDSKIAVINASGMGIVLPILNEYATSIAPRMAIVVHEKLPKSSVKYLGVDQREYGALVREELEKTEFLNGLFLMGYNYIAWGLLEELEWGAIVKKKALRQENLVANCGQVNLYKFYGDLETPDFNHDQVYEEQTRDATSVKELVKLGLAPFWKNKLIHTFVISDHKSKLISASTISELIDKVKYTIGPNDKMNQ